MQQQLFIEALFKGTSGLYNVREIDQDQGDQEYKPKIRNKFLNYNELEKYIPPKDKHIYICPFTRNGRDGTAKGCKETKAIWADYDNGATIEYAKQRISEAGLPEPSIFINSGHGIHAYWLLDKPVGKEVLPVLKAIVTTTGSDPRVADIARPMRLPGSMNVKYEPFVECKLIETGLKEYPLQIFKDILNIKEAELTRDRLLSNIKPKEISYLTDRPLINAALPQDLINSNMSCIQRASQGVPKHYRNFSMIKIMQYLKLKGYGRKDIFNIILQWNKLNIPPKPENELISEFNCAYDKPYEFLGCNFKDPDLQRKQEFLCSMGECRYHTRQEMSIVNQDSSQCEIDNKIFKDTIYPNIDGLTIAMFCVIEKAEEIGITRGKLAKLVNRHVKNSTFINSIQLLKNIEFITIEKGKSRYKGQEDIIKVNKQGNYRRGYTLINSLLNECYLGGRINDTDYKLLVLLKSYSFKNTEVYPTIERLAVKMGVSERTITRSLKKLSEEKQYIKRDYRFIDSGKYKLFITLKF